MTSLIPVVFAATLAKTLVLGQCIGNKVNPRVVKCACVEKLLELEKQPVSASRITAPP